MMVRVGTYCRWISRPAVTIFRFIGRSVRRGAHGRRPGAIATSGFALAETPARSVDATSTRVVAGAEIAATGSRTALMAILSGVAAGIATLTRPSWLLFTPLLIARFLLV